MDIPAWLRTLGLAQYEPTFRANDIDGAVLPRLTSEDLKELGVTSIGHRRKMLAALATLRVKKSRGLTSDGADAPPPEPELRLVTVLFVDLVDYTALSVALEAEALLALLERYLECVDHIVKQHNGFVERHIGDCVMAVFGAPIAHDNDAERAIRAALAVCQAMPALSAELERPIRVHIGIAGGQVVASSSGSPGHGEYTITGQTVNLASRLADAALPGEILIAGMIQRELSDRLDCEEADALDVKGFAAPVSAWRVHGIHTPASSGRAVFVGRRGEMGQFRAALTACQDHGRGQTVYIRGEAGIGKTRLVEEFQRDAAAAGFACHVGMVFDFGTRSGRDAIRSIVRQLLGLGAFSNADEANCALARAVVSGLVLDEDSVFLNDLLDLPQPKDMRTIYEAMSNPARNEGKRQTVASLVVRASRVSPRLLVVEDVHWADPLQLAYLAGLAARTAECPTLLVLTSRTEGDQLDREWRSQAATSSLITIDLGPLLPEEASTLASAMLKADDQYAKQCIARAAGNPLFLEQLLRHGEAGARAGVPNSIQNLVQARVDRLDPEDKAAVQAASVLGQAFDRNNLSHVLGRVNYTPERLAKHFLVQARGEAFLFTHALIRDAIYDGLLRSRRRQLHRRAADWFATRDLTLHAEHLDRADDPGTSRAYLAAALSEAAKYHYELARRLINRGVVVAVDRADRFNLARAQADILHDLGETAAARAAYEVALETAEPGMERCGALIGLASVKRVAEDLKGAVADLKRAKLEAVKHGLTAEQARIHYLKGNLCFPQGDIIGCLREHELSRELARKAGSPELEAAALGGLGDAEYVRGRMVSANKYFTGCVELCREHGLGRTEVANLSMVPTTRIYLNELRPALEQSRAAAAAAARVGHHRAEVIAHNAACIALTVLGEMSKAREHLDARVPLIQRLGARRFEASRLRDEAAFLTSEGRRREAVEVLHRGLAISRETGAGFMGPWLLGQLAATTDAPQERRRVLEEGESILRAGAVSHSHLWFYYYAIEAMLRARSWTGMKHYAAKLEEFTRAEPLPWSTFFVRRARALAVFEQGTSEPSFKRELCRLVREAKRFDLVVALPALEAAISRAGFGSLRAGRS